mgnify:CR=1 FL=1
MLNAFITVFDKETKEIRSDGQSPAIGNRVKLARKDSIKNFVESYFGDRFRIHSIVLDPVTKESPVLLAIFKQAFSRVRNTPLFISEQMIFSSSDETVVTLYIGKYLVYILKM